MYRDVYRLSIVIFFFILLLFFSPLLHPDTDLVPKQKPEVKQMIHLTVDYYPVKGLEYGETGSYNYLPRYNYHSYQVEANENP